jgi:hypothetical protein
MNISHFRIAPTVRRTCWIVFPHSQGKYYKVKFLVLCASRKRSERVVKETLYLLKKAFEVLQGFIYTLYGKDDTN